MVTALLCTFTRYLESLLCTFEASLLCTFTRYLEFMTKYEHLCWLINSLVLKLVVTAVMAITNLLIGTGTHQLNYGSGKAILVVDKVKA